MFFKGWTNSWFYRTLFSVESWVKGLIFGCHSCGQCIVRTLPLVCPMQCPKQMRNGPCGGSRDSLCEVFPERQCVWAKVYERAERWGWSENLTKVQPAVDWSLSGTSAIWNIVEGKIDTHGGVKSPHPEPLKKPPELDLAQTRAAANADDEE
jgi:hypothetical protein